MALTYFPVTATLRAVVSDSSDAGGDPDLQNISSFCYFKPSVKQVYDTDTNTIYRLQTIRARTNIDDGQLKNIDGTTVSLVANTSNLHIDELTYTVSFDHTVYDEGHNEILPFTFTAPTDTTPIDLATVERTP